MEATGRLGKDMTLPKETGGWPFLRDQLGGCLRRPKRRLSFARVEIGWLTAERRSFNLALAACRAGTQASALSNTAPVS